MTRPDTFHNFADLSEGIARVLADGVETRVFPGEQAMLSVVSFEPGSEGSIHAHPEEQWGVLLEGSGTRIQDGVEVPVGSGDFWRTPGGVEHGFRAGPEGAKVLDIFAPRVRHTGNRVQVLPPSQRDPYPPTEPSPVRRSVDSAAPSHRNR